MYRVAHEFIFKVVDTPPVPLFFLSLACCNSLIIKGYLIGVDNVQYIVDNVYINWQSATCIAIYYIAINRTYS